MRFPSWPEWLHSGKTLLAALAALYIALAIPLDNPYWAMATVYIVANPLSGATRSKAIFRVCGTLLGAIMSILIMPLFAHQPMMLCLVIGLWVGFLLFLSLLDRSPRAYVFMLAAYSVPLIALSQVDSPSNIFHTALARSEEILLGIVCASVVNLVVLPKRIAPVMTIKMDLLLKDARLWTHGVLTGQMSSQSSKKSLQKLLADVSMLDGLILQMGYDATYHRATLHAQDFRARLALLAPQLLALSAPIEKLLTELNTLPEALTDYLSQVDAYIQKGTQDAATLRTQSRELEPELTAQHPEHALVLSNILSHCRLLLDLWQDALALRQRFADGEPNRDTALRYRVKSWVGGPQHYDFGLLAFNAFSVGLSIIVAALCWYASGWEHGYSAVFLAAVVGCFFAGQDNPVPFIRDFLLWSTVSCVVAGIYLFLLLPNVQDFGSLALLLAIPLLLLGTLGARPQFAPTVMALAVQSLSTIMIRDSYSADFAVFMDVCAATITGLVFALVWASVTRPFGLERTAKRLALSSWRDLARLCQPLQASKLESIAARMIDRTSQLLPRLAAVRNANIALTDASRDLRICFLLQHLRNQPLTAPVEAFLDELGLYYQDCIKAHRPLPYPPALGQTLEQLLAQPLVPSAKHALLGLELALAPAQSVTAL